MNEWTVVTVLIALVGLIGTVTVPLVKFTSELSKLSAIVQNSNDKLDKSIIDNNEGHRRIWKELDKLDGVNSQQDIRISIIEAKETIK